MHNNVMYAESHVIWYMMTGEWPTLQIDHINRDDGDNRWSNLRQVTNQQNCFNKGISKANTSGCTGVWWRESHQKWRAYIRVDGKLIHLGHFKEYERAVQARKHAEEVYFGSRMAA